MSPHDESGHGGSLDTVCRHTGGSSKYVLLSSVPINLIANLHYWSAFGPEVLANSAHLVCNCLVRTCTLAIGMLLKVKCTEPWAFDFLLNLHSVPLVTSTVGSDGTCNKTELFVLADKDSHESLLDESVETV